jgi:LacI family transcriptional regulator
MYNATIKDVAKEASVSIATVSLVINNNGRISQQTRKKVLKAIKKLNYHPSRSARGLVSQKTGNIGFILTEEHFLRTEPFYTKIFLGTEFEARSKDYYVLLATVNSSFNEGDPLPRFIAEKNFDGIVIAGKVPTALTKSILKYNKPTVFVDFSPNINNKDYTNILTDNIKGGQLATDHLIKYGHKKIAFIGGEISHPSISERLHGYKLALDRAKLNIDESVIITNDDELSRQNGCAAAELLISKKKHVTAIFAANDATAIGVMQCLKDNGIKIPDEISVVGFDDVEADLFIDPPLTTIRVPKLDMGTEAIQLLIGLINNENVKVKKILMPVELIMRKSTKNINVV